ncbi:hypothetical protein MSPP1_002044 [Malassezia sp. CBS 17886]|nr:hypothetical protein MSPP1_002044 [Malassezia sp. CBS 17886]
MRLACTWLVPIYLAAYVVAQSTRSTSSGSAAPSLGQNVTGPPLVNDTQTPLNGTNGTEPRSRPPLPPGFVNPLDSDDGSMLAFFHHEDPFGEPLNVIVSSMSSKDVLNPEGFLVWVTALGFGVSCLGQGDNSSFQYADLGAGNMNVRQGSVSGNNGVMRWNYGMPSVGTCKETVVGGNHFRWFQQHSSNGTAMFLATSFEEPLSQQHTVQKDGYNRGRDNVVQIATQPNGVEWQGNEYNATVAWVPAGRLLNATSKGINHPEVAPKGGTAIDGRVAVLNVTMIRSSDGAQASDAMLPYSPPFAVIGLLAILTIFFLGLSGL